MSEAVENLNTIATTNASKVTKASLALQKVANDLVAASESYEDLVVKTELKNLELTEIESKFKEKSRAAEVDLEISVKENAFAIINKVLIEQKKIAIDGDELHKLRNELAVLQQEFDQKVKAEIGKAVGMEKNRADHALKEKELEYQAKEAQNIATISSQQERLNMFQDQIGKYESQMQEERIARVEEAKARGTGTPVSVTTGK